MMRFAGRPEMLRWACARVGDAPCLSAPADRAEGRKTER